jgi:hypothetical protein
LVERFRQPTLDAGRYWLDIHTGGTAGVMRYFYDYGGNWYGNDDVFTDGTSTPFGAGTPKNHTISAYISYRPGTITTDTLGLTEIGTNPSHPLDPDFIRWSTFRMEDTDATLTGLHAYLDGLGSTSGSQDVRMVLYGYFNVFDPDHPETEPVFHAYKVAESAPVTIAAGMPPRWVSFTVPPIVLHSGAGYSLGIHTSGPNAVARDYSDNRHSFGNWRNRPDAFADGAEESFLEKDPSIGSKPDITLSVYASYSLPPP